MKKMLTKLKMSLTNNIGLKFLAVLIALVLWLAIVNVNDPEKTITVSNIPISVTNESAITSRDMVYNVKSEQYLNITVSGKRSIVSNLSAEDFRATASLKELSKVNSIPVDVTTKNASLGRKITIDSSTMVNKGLEVMEAKWLFGVEYDQVQVVIQPQSIIHSMVQYKDGAVIAQLGTPDMKLPIQYALFYPDREYLAGERLDFWSLSQITFEKPDMENFEGLPLAFAAAKAGGSMPTVFNAANERAVSKFLNRKIGFLDIYEIIKTCMDAHKVIEAPTVEQILQCEQETYEMIESRW